jgi:phage-related holin
MEPISILTYIAISHFSYTVVNNFLDYIKIKYNFYEIQQDLSFVNNKADTIICLHQELSNDIKKLKQKIDNTE